MNQIFSMDNVVFRTIGKMVDLVWVNILTLIFAIPIITAGASFTAMYSVLLKLADNKEGGLTRGFWNAFRENFKKATLAWLVVLLVGLFYAMNLNLMQQGVMQGYGIFEIVVMVVILLIVVVCAMIYLFFMPLMARYENTIKGTLINACKLVLAFFPRALCMIAIWLFPIALMCISNYFFFLWGLYGFTFPAYVCCMLLNRIFEKVEEATQVEEAVFDTTEAETDES